MCSFKNILVITSLLLSCTSVLSHDAKLRVQLKSLKCTFDAAFYNGTMKCFIKPYRNGTHLATAIHNFRKPCNDMWVHIMVFFKFGGSALYRPWMFNVDENLCAIYGGKHGPGTLAKLLLGVLDQMAPGMLHKCPYIGEEGIRNLDFDQVVSRTVPQVLPNGDYRVLFRYHTSKNETFIEALFGAHVAASNPMEAVSMG